MYVDTKKDAKSWEMYFKDVLRKYYGPSNMKDIPDAYGGDFGIECYSFSGHVFQCYLPTQYSDIAKLSHAQKNKIRTDIYKFTTKNKTAFTTMFEGKKISRWILATPYYLDSEVALYCSAKSAKVRKLGLPYVDDDFQILLQTEDDYKTEVKSLLSDQYQLDLDFIKVDEENTDEWINDHLPFLNHLDNKLPKVVDANKIVKIKSSLVQKYLGYQNLLQYLKDEWPEIHTKINSIINDRQDYLELRFLSSNANLPTDVIRSELDNLKKVITTEFPSIRNNDVELIVNGVIADWLIRCPLDF